MKTVLLDTHMALWLFAGDDRLPASLVDAMARGSAHFLFHQVSLWEIQIKYDLRKLNLPAMPGQYIPQLVTRSGLTRASIQDEAILMLGKLPDIHRDPFDRLLVAHAILNGWAVATTDQTMARYPISLFG